MHFKFREYQFSKIKQYLKTEFLLFANGTNKNASNWLIVEQSLNNLGIKYYKIYNKIAFKAIKMSLLKNIKQLIKGTFFFLKLDNNSLSINKKIFLKSLELIFFNLLSVKLNNKIYSITQLKNMSSLKYHNNIAILFQFLTVSLKSTYKIANKKSKNIETM